MILTGDIGITAIRAQLRHPGVGPAAVERVRRLAGVGCYRRGVSPPDGKPGDGLHSVDMVVRDQAARLASDPGIACDLSKGVKHQGMKSHSLLRS
jgi:hypothetical protein